MPIVWLVILYYFIVTALDLKDRNGRFPIRVVFQRTALATEVRHPINHGFCYWLYGVMSILAGFFVWKFVPETKGRSLEEMERLWVRRS